MQEKKLVALKNFNIFSNAVKFGLSIYHQPKNPNLGLVIWPGVKQDPAVMLPAGTQITTHILS